MVRQDDQNPVEKTPFKSRDEALHEHSSLPDSEDTRSKDNRSNSSSALSSEQTSATRVPLGPRPEKSDDAKKPSLLARLRYFLPPSVHRPIVRAVRRMDRNSADWHWMADKPMPLKGLNRTLWRSAEPSFSYYIMLLLSGIISTLGLLAGSTAAIIGAMIVAPLMGPITSMAFAITMGNRRLLKRSLLSVSSGVLLTIFTAYFISTLLGFSTLNSEIMERTRPTLIDLAIGLAAGAAGSFAKTRKDIADALPGVAIAVALVPPLSVIGIGIAFGSRDVMVGSTLLFATNLAGIILAGGLVFIWQDYGSLKKAKSGLGVSLLVLFLLGIPLGISLRELVVEERARSLVNNLLRNETITFEDVDIRKLRVTSLNRRALNVEIEIAAPVDAVSDNQINLVHSFLEERMARPIRLDVDIVPMQGFSAESSDLKGPRFLFDWRRF